MAGAYHAVRLRFVEGPELANRSTLWFHAIVPAAGADDTRSYDQFA